MAIVVRFKVQVLICLVLVSLSCQRKVSIEHIRIDGSSTVYPISEAVAEEFQKTQSSRVTIGVGGTGSGFAKLCRGEIALANASRPIKENEEALCKKNHVDFIELPIAYDGIVVVVHPKADWIKEISVNDLKRLFEPAAQGKIKKWNQINPAWPDAEIHLFSPGVDSGTFDYFTSAIVGKEKASRGDVTSSEDDNVLVQGVATDIHALGYFGFAYYFENKSKLKAVAINGVMPSRETVLDGSYKPLSRPLFIYLKADLESKSMARDFVRFYLDRAHTLVDQVGYIRLQEPVMDLVKKRFQLGRKGTMYGKDASTQGVALEVVLRNDR